MTRPLILTLALLASASVLIAGAATAPKETQPREERTSNEPAALDVYSVASKSSLVDPEPIPVTGDCICPVYPYAYHQGYWSYYAIRCSNCSPGSLDAEPNLPATSCPGCYGNPPGDCPGGCIATFTSGNSTLSVTARHAAQVAPGHYVVNVRKNGSAGIGKTGFSRKRGRTYQIHLNKRIATAKGEFVVKVVRKNGQSFLAKLVLISVNPQRIPKLPKRFSHLKVRNEGLGFEIDEPATTNVESGNVLTEQAGHVVAVKDQPFCYLVRFKHDWYRVLCHAGNVR